MGSLALDSGSIVDVALGAPGGAGLFDVAGDLTLGGTLNVTGIAGFAEDVLMEHDLTIGENLVVGADVDIVSDLTVDTSTFVVIASTNRVGVGTATPGANLESNGYFRVTNSTNPPSSGAGVGIQYNTATDVGTINAFKFGTGLRTIALDGITVMIAPSPGRTLSFFNAAGATQQTISSARDDPEGALADLLDALDAYGLIVDSTTAT